MTPAIWNEVCQRNSTKEKASEREGAFLVVLHSNYPNRVYQNVLKACQRSFLMGQIKGRTCWRFTIIESNVLVCLLRDKQHSAVTAETLANAILHLHGNRNVSAHCARGLARFSELRWRTHTHSHILMDSQTHASTHSQTHTLTHTLVLFHLVSQAYHKELFCFVLLVRLESVLWVFLVHMCIQSNQALSEWLLSSVKIT